MAYPNYTGLELEALWQTTKDSTDAIANITSKVDDIFAHNASGGRWYGASAGPVAPGLDTSLVSWEVTAGAVAGTYGTAIAIFDGTETFDFPTTPVQFHIHELLITDVGTDSLVWKLRFANSNWDGSAHTYATMAEAVTAKKYTDFTVQVDKDKEPATSIEFQSGLANVGSIVWCQITNSGGNATDLDFLVGLHVH